MAKPRTPYVSGGSTVVSLPPDVMAEAGVDLDTDLMIETDGQEITLTPIEFQKAHRAGGGSDA